MAYASPMKIANGLVLDFTVDGAVTATDAFLGLNALGEVTQFASVPRARVSGGGNITESTSAVLTITGGTGAALTSALTIQVLQAGAAQSGYLSTTDWNTFNNKLSSSLTSANIYVGNGSNIATGVAMSGDISITNAGVAAIATGVIVDADVNAGAAIAFSKMAALTANRIVASNGSGVVSILDTATYPSLTELSYVKGVTSSLQTQIDSKLSVTLAGVTSGDVISYNGAAWVNTPSSGTGIPTAGTTNQILRKIDNTNYNAEWHTLVAADLTDVSSSAAELNKLTGVTTTATQFNFSNTLVGDIQSQINTKLSSSLTTNSMWIGVAGVAGELAAGANGYVLTSVSGLPTWVSPGAGGTVTSVAGSGGTTGMSFTGSPITVSGTLTLTGTLIAANGGTGFASYAVGDILYANTTTTLAKLADVAAGSYLRSGGVSTAPVWSTTTLPNSATTGDILYASASNVYSNLGAGTVNYILTSNGAGVAPSWQAAAAGFADPMTTRGDIIIRNSSNVTARLGIGANTYVLTSDGTDITWQPSSGGSGFWSLASGGTATGTNTFAMGSNPFIMTTGVTTGTGATAGHQLVGNSLTTGNLFDASSSSVSTGALGVFTSTSTVIDHTAGTNGLVEVLMSGANSTDNKTAIGFYSKVINTGTTNTNIAGYFEASGGTTNLALHTLGSVFIANASGDTPTANTRLDVRGVDDAGGFIFRGANQSNALRMTLTGAGVFEVGNIGTSNLSVTGNTISFLETGSSRGQIFSTGSTTRIYAGSSTGSGTFQIRTTSLSMNNASATSFGSWAPTGLNVLAPGNATSTATQANSPFVTFTSGFWDGAAATSRYYGIRQVASTTVNLTGRLSFYENIATGSERETMSISTNGNLAILGQSVSASWNPVLTITPGAHTLLTASTAFPNHVFESATQSWVAVAGTIAAQKDTEFRAITHSAATSGTFTDLYNVYMEAPLVGGAATAVNSYALGLGGNLIVGSSSIAASIYNNVDAATYTNGHGLQNRSDVQERCFDFLWLATSGASGNQDVSPLWMANDSTCTITITIAGVAADGSEGYSAVLIASFRKDGAATPVQIGATSVVHQVEDSGSTPTSSIAMSGTNIRVSYDSNSATVYHWTAWAKIATTKV